MSEADCLLCRGSAADEALARVQVWTDELWRLTVSLDTEIVGLAYLEPRVHVRGISDLPDDHVATLGPVLASSARALERATGTDRSYVYVVGEDVDHLHFYIAPHSRGDALSSHVVRGPLVRQRLADGNERMMNPAYPLAPIEELVAVAGRVRDVLNG